jgi:hypothetical protein
MIKVKQINAEYVRPVKLQVGEGDKRPIKGANLFTEIYANILIVAKKKSGKTTVELKIVKDCCTKETTVIVFCSTVDKDKNHLAIKQYCKRAGIPYVAYTSMKEEDIDVLDVLIKKLQEDAKQPESDSEEEEEQQKGKGMILFDESDESDEEEERPRKCKFNAPEYMLIFDDISAELKSKVLTKLCKMNRHFKTKIIISTQYIHDVLPETIRQQDYCLVFKGESLEKLQKIHKDLDLSIEFEKFVKIYHNATQAKFSFLYIDARSEEFRRCFTHLYKIENISA